MNHRVMRLPGRMRGLSCINQKSKPVDNYRTIQKAKLSRRTLKQQSLEGLVGFQEDFSRETEEWVANTDLAERRLLGQFMTPRFLRTYLLNQLMISPGARILDPAVGTGEFLRQVKDQHPQAHVVGWDVDEKILKVAHALVPEADLVCRSALEDFVGDPFDFVIGNPPYFEIKLDKEIKNRFKEVISGRPNIFSLFFKAGIDALRVGGTLAFVVPPSMNAGAYFTSLRNYLTTDNHVISLKVFHESTHFDDAQTSVQVIVIRKGPGTSSNVFLAGSRDNTSLIFSENPEELEEIYSKGVSLYSLGYEAVTGSTVWNQNKSILSNERGGSTIPLIYARNLVGGRIVLSADERRPQYIKQAKGLCGPAILVNRIIGGVGAGSINAAVVPSGYIYTAENHLNVIRPRAGITQVISIEELFNIIKLPETTRRARLVTGNTQLSAREWTHMLPLPEISQSKRGNMGY